MILTIVLTLAGLAGQPPPIPEGLRTAYEEVASDPAVRERKINVFCADEWPTNFRMQRFCRKTHHEALRALFGSRLPRMTEEGMDASTRSGIFWSCLEDWTNAGYIFNWRMVAFCVKEHHEAWRALRP